MHPPDKPGHPRRPDACVEEEFPLAHRLAARRAVRPGRGSNRRHAIMEYPPDWDGLNGVCCERLLLSAYVCRLLRNHLVRHVAGADAEETGAGTFTHGLIRIGVAFDAVRVGRFRRPALHS